MPDLLLQALKRISPVSESVLGPVLEGARTREFDKGSHLLLEGQRSRSVFFVRAGLVRMYLLRGDGREFNKAFHREGEFTGSHAAVVTGEPSLTSIQALEPVTVQVFAFDALEELAAEHIEVERMLRRLAEQRFWHRERREAQLLLESATQRFERLRQEEPWLLGRVAQKQLASYLGITEVSLSRLRSQLERSKRGR